MTLYLKYRAVNLDELDIESVRDSLKKIITSGNIPHAFLFAGPKGTGKTSAARILAKIINCEHLGKNGAPCNKCGQCTSITKGNNLDVIELDAASHRGIDDVRTLKDAVKLSPVKANKKVYIIDEAHMLTTEASNALLKTLEEPPAHVVFILATTNPEKLIDTIKSRTTLVSFTKAKPAEIVRSLSRVVQGEKLKISGEALEVIAQNADGAFRDAIKILEQVITENIDLSKESLDQYLLGKKLYDTDNFISLLAARDLKNLLAEVETITGRGASIELFLKNLLTKLRLGLLAKVGAGGAEVVGFEKDELIYLIEILTEASRNLSGALIEELPLELAVIKWCEGGDGDRLQSAHLEQNSSAASSGTGHDSSRSATHADHDLTQTVAPDVRRQTTDQSGSGELGLNDEIWKTILATVRPINASIEALLRAAKPINYSGGTLTLGVYYKFHKERLEDGVHRRILEDVVTKILQSPTRVICTLTEPPPRKIIEEAKSEPVLTEGGDRDIIKVAEEIFGN